MRGQSRCNGTQDLTGQWLDTPACALSPPSFAAPGDRAMFYNVYRYFEARNMSIRGSPAFTEAENCAECVRAFKEWFETESIARINRWSIMN